MPRIYAFAKELGLDNKQLLDICDQAGVKGKGSALASLDDAEVATIKAFIESGGEVVTAKDEPEQTVAPVRDDMLVGGEGPLRDLDHKPKKPKPVPAPETATPPPVPKPDPVPVPKPEAPVRPPVPEPEPPVPVAKKKPSRPVIKPTKLPDRGAKKEDRKREPRKKGGIVFNVAKMPEVKQPTAKDTGPKEKVQKPDISLPQDAIRKARSGAAPLEQFTKQTKGKTQKKGRDGRPIPDVADAPTPGRGKGRRGTKEKTGVDSDLGSTRQQRTRRRRPNQGDDDGRYRRRPMRRRSGPAVNTAAPRKDAVVLQLPCTIRDFSEAAGVPSVKLLLTLKQLGEESRKTINSELEDDYVDLLIDHFGIENIEVRQAESLEDQILAEFGDDEDDPDSLVPRAPIVTFLGHVDHGKTSLLDALIGIDVVSGEAGGITQHIRAYEIKKGDNKIAFVDTPGHEAFTEMRARGANVTDIAVLVVAADDGVMPQTEEAISHARAAEVPIVVAMNKIDLPGANPDKVYQDLAAHDLLPSEWGGDIEVVKTSAIKGIGLDDLLETVLVTAELHEFKANPDRKAFGTCLEAEQQPGKGVVAKIMVQGGTLAVGDIVVCGAAHGRVKAMYDTLHPRKKLKKAGPSTPINLTGLDVAPEAGDKFYVLDDIANAREVAQSRGHRQRVGRIGGISKKKSFEEFQELFASGSFADPQGERIKLNLIIRADVQGSIEAIQKELGKIDHPEVEIRLLQALPGGVTVGDVRLAEASEAVIIGFNVVANEDARSLAEDLQVEIRRYEVIYKVTDDIKAILEGRLKPEEQVVEQGMAMVLQTFNISKTGTIAGCRVMRGTIQRECRIRVIRDSRIIGDYAIDSLKRIKDDAKEVQRGMECGIKLVGYNDVKEGDTLEAYKIEEVARTL